MCYLLGKEGVTPRGLACSVGWDGRMDIGATPLRKERWVSWRKSAQIWMVEF